MRDSLKLAQKNYRLHVKQFTLQFNLNKPDDLKCYNYLISKSNKSSYVMSLILKDLEQ